MANLSKSNVYRALPEIPGRVYKICEPRWLRIAIFSFFLALAIYVHLTEEGSAIWLILLLLILAVINIFFSSKTIFADLTETTVTAKLENGQGVEKDDLENYVLFIKEGARGPGTALSANYKYGVSLVHRGKIQTDYAGQSVIQIYPKNKDHLIITLIDDILCPVNLREWIKHFQSLIKAPLPLLFESPKIQSDYETGKFRSMEK